ncbi:MAG: NRDE family protein [Bacteroidetes bacterium]|nr:NRDE family protein [Bacteroidota bacterium]
MCTVTFIPDGKGDYTFTTNRDEAPHRSPENLDKTEMFDRELLFPRDTTAGGTWVAVSDRGQLVCLLNGAFVKHKHRPPYRRSRGLMVLDYFSFRDVNQFCRHYRFEGMEPFTFLVIENDILWEIRWDESKLYQLKLDFSRPYIWASAPLYDEEAQKKRRKWFKSFLTQNPDPDSEQILTFHRYTGDGDSYNDLVMNRQNKVRTVSISRIVRSGTNQEFTYVDLLRDTKKQEDINYH